MRKSLFIGSIIAALSISVSISAQASPEAEDGWKNISSGQTCLHRGRIAPMHSLNGEMRKTQCFTLQTKRTKSGERVYQNVSRDGSVTIKGKRLV